MIINDVNLSNEELDSLPLLRDVVIRRECKFKSPLSKNMDRQAKTKLIIAVVLCILFFMGEIIGGIIANSLAILTDSAHLFSDLSSFLISLGAMCLSARQSTKSMNFGWHRAEIIGALFSVLLIWIVTGVLIYAAILRIINSNYVINANIMLIMSAVGVIINVLLALVLHPQSHGHSHGGGGHGHSHGHGQSNGGGGHGHGHGHGHRASVNHNHSQDVEHCQDSDEPLLTTNSDVCAGEDSSKSKVFKSIDNINLRAAFIHVIGDIIQSFGVLAAAFIIYFKPQWKIADPICTFLFSFLVMLTTIFIFRDVIYVLLERKPRHINYNKVTIRISSIPGIVQIHNLRLWSITLTKTALSCHLVVDASQDSQSILEKVYDMCIEEFKISEITIQIESSAKPSALCDQSD
uniref:Slc30a-10 n=1 Tax=Schmidtea mediterranea TaxID=79327 RepID=A0A0H3YF85_SCHMD|nr:slc30a-10 [Schmidtea mediterranea]